MLMHRGTVHGRRREYRGKDQRTPVVDPSYVHRWIESYIQATSLMESVCDDMAGKYEDVVGRLGYSMQRGALKRVQPTHFLRQFNYFDFTEDGDDFPS